MKKIVKMILVLGGFVGFMLSGYSIYLACESPSFGRILGSIIFILLSIFLILEGTGKMEKIEKKVITMQINFKKR